MTLRSRPAAHSSLLLASACLGLLACRNSPSLAGGVSPTPSVVHAPLSAGSSSAYEVAGRLALPETDPEDHPALHNVYELSENIISGGEPENEEAFRILQEKGVRTILSVDGKVPDAELAAEYGMKYVHVPIQYKGITDEEVAKITKTFREQEGPFYVHCYHGQHRGPAAAAIGRLLLDGVPREEAVAEMRQWCGTSSSYEGLYARVAFGEVPAENETRSMEWDFPSADPLDGVAGAMVQIARAHGAVKSASRNDWKPNPNHPDLNVANESVKLAELFERAGALEEVSTRPEDFRRWMQESKAQAAALRDSVLAMEAGSGTMDDAYAAYQTLSSTCRSCHDQYRN